MNLDHEASGSHRMLNFIAFLLVIAPLPALSQSGSNSVADQIAACSAVADADTRLKCFDQIGDAPAVAEPEVVEEPAAVETPEPEPASEPAAMETYQPADEAPATTYSEPVEQPAPSSADGASNAAAAAATAAVGVEAMGENHLREPVEEDAKAPKQADVVIVQTSLDAYGRWIFVLENGQIWRQTEKGKHVSGPKVPAGAELRRGFLGSYSLNIEETGQKIAIKRIE